MIEKKLTSPSLTALGAVYKGDNPIFFELALNSVINQTYPADEILLVVDGPINDDLKAIIEKYRQQLTTVYLKENIGLGGALNFGLKTCKSQLVARWDSDDIQIKTRFESQLSQFQENQSLMVLGGHISEFKDDENDIVQYRKTPLTNANIIEFAKTRNPMNHVTVMFRKRFIDNLGGYRNVTYMEDYDLWLRVINEKAEIKNLDKILCNVRIGNNMVGRRKGIENIKSELKIFLLKLSIFGFDFKILFWTVGRIISRFLPIKALEFVYRKILR